jgi:hypothetical protein
MDPAVHAIARSWRARAVTFRRMSSTTRLVMGWAFLVVMLGGCCFGGASPSPPLTLAPGFTPQPTTQTGTTRSLLVDAAVRIGWQCQSWIPTEPQHVVNVTSPMFLRVMARGAGATRLVVRYPDGVYHCSDFLDSADPAVEGFAGVGTVAVFVGSTTSNAELDYTVGFTETPGLPSSVLP